MTGRSAGFFELSSIVFRRGGDVSFVAEELKAIFDPQGGHWIGGNYVPSLIAAIGAIIEGHLSGLENGERAAALTALAVGGEGGGPKNEGPAGTASSGRESASGAGSPGRGGHGLRFCPQCSSPRYRMEGNCRVCLECGYASCG